ncbi:MAG: tetratricopeptide repeat protein, partial [Deltaproteobacteria bacterium]|nr:tetratricopeptide repeat protein [Deltaproteobacteria bacterium]
LIFSAVLFFIPSTVRAVEGQGNASARQFSFAEALLAEGDYYRAITEFKRFVFFFPQDALVEKSTFRIAESYYKAKRWAEAVDTFSAFSTKYPQSLMTANALYFKGLAEKELKRYQNALLTFQEIIREKSKDYADKAIYQSALVLIEMGEWLRSMQTFSLVPQGSPLSSSAHIMSSGLERMDDIPQKSPALAGTLAAILPGAGHFYTERYRDALVAFLLNGAFIWGAVELFQHDNPVAGGIVTFFEIGWYVGNIYSAVDSAHKYNKRTKEEFIQHLKVMNAISFSHDPVTSANQIIFSLRF